MQNLSGRGYLQARPQRFPHTNLYSSLAHNLRLKTHEEGKNQQTNGRIKPLRNSRKKYDRDKHRCWSNQNFERRHYGKKEQADLNKDEMKLWK